MEQETDTKGTVADAPAAADSLVLKQEEEEATTSNETSPALVDEDEVDDEEDDQLVGGKSEEVGDQPSTETMSCSSVGTTEIGKPKRKKAKGRNGNIYIGVTNRIEWFRLQEKFGFDNVNLFGNFVMNYMEKVYSDFDILHEMTVKTGLFEEQGLTGFRWVNGMPHAVDASDNIITLPVLDLSDEVADQGFKIALDMVLNRNPDFAHQQAEFASDPTIPEVILNAPVDDESPKDDTKENEPVAGSSSSKPATSSGTLKLKIKVDLEGKSNVVSCDDNQAKEPLEKELAVNIPVAKEAKKESNEANAASALSTAIVKVEPDQPLNLAVGSSGAPAKTSSKATPKGRATKRKPAKRSSSRKSAKNTKKSKVQK